MEQCRKGEDWREEKLTNRRFMFLDSMLASFTPDFLNADKTSHRGHRSIQWTSALVDIAARNLANLPPVLTTRMEKVLSRHPRFAITVPILIGFAVGAGVIGTAGATAHFVAQEESSTGGRRNEGRTAGRHK